MQASVWGEFLFGEKKNGKEKKSIGQEKGLI
jgi:hypothetical protein